MLLPFAILIIGFVVLIKGADYLVEGASSIAKRFKISDLVIGLTIVAFGTSAPELLVNLVSSLQGNSEIAIGNILGSNIANVFLILGIAAIIYPLTVSKGTTYKEIPFSLLAALMLFFLVNDAMIDGQNYSILSRIDGFVLIAFLMIFMYYVFGIAKKGSIPEDVSGLKIRSLRISIFMILLGCAGLVAGGKWVVDSAVEIASFFGVSQSLIGLTIVAVGTSLPELATSAVAAYKKNADIAVGNIVGSNIFNVFWILGLSSIINPIPFQPRNNFDLLVVIFSSLLLFIFMFLGTRHRVDRWEGIMFVVLYISYISFLVYQG
ncbi:calcium/sodium antiporter [Candidatus Peregrinibacteria bacterium]|nr:calcium/sodium antiporter [Candidatus Peregrinibacteria bacterium]